MLLVHIVSHFLLGNIASPLSSTDDSTQELDFERPRERRRSLSKRFKSGTRTTSNIYQDDSGTT